MERKDKQRFVQIMLGMADNFRDAITKEGMNMRWDMLNEFSIEQIEAAAKKIIRIRKYTKMPPVAEFFEAIQGNQETKIEDKALIIAHKIIANIGQKGCKHFPDLQDDPIAKHLMTTRWPYYSWATYVLESELKWWTREFCEAYRAYSDTGVPLQIEAPESIKKLTEGIGNYE